ncbi:MAG: hypothetical protein ACRBBM_18195 [Pseudomonadaceae bacterium]
MSKPAPLELEEVELRCSRIVAKLMVDDAPSLGEHGQVAEAQLSPDELRQLAAKCTEIADWLEREECDHSRKGEPRKLGELYGVPFFSNLHDVPPHVAADIAQSFSVFVGECRVHMLKPTRVEIQADE